MNKKKYKLKKDINELVDDTLSLIHGDDESHNLSNVQSKKTMDARVAAQTQPYSWNKKLGFGAEYFPDAYFYVSEEDEKLKKENIDEIVSIDSETAEKDPDLVKKLQDKIGNEDIIQIKEEQRALDMIENIIKKRMKENILSRRTELNDLETPSSILSFDELKKEHPLISKDITTLTDKLSQHKDEIKKYGATILMEIINSLNIENISSKLKRILINRIKGIEINNTV